MARYGGFTDKTGDFEHSTYAFIADAIAVIVGSCFGSSPCTAFVESGTGIAEGGMYQCTCTFIASDTHIPTFLIGRTGITAITIAFGFFISIFFSPIFASFPPWATGPALIIVGSMMATSVRNINWDYPGGTYRPYVSFYTLEHHLTLLAFFFYRRYSCFHYANGHAIHLFHRL